MWGVNHNKKILMDPEKINGFYKLTEEHIKHYGEMYIKLPPQTRIHGRIPVGLERGIPVEYFIDSNVVTEENLDKIEDLDITIDQKELFKNYMRYKKTGQIVTKEDKTNICIVHETKNEYKRVFDKLKNIPGINLYKAEDEESISKVMGLDNIIYIVSGRLNIECKGILEVLQEASLDSTVHDIKFIDLTDQLKSTKTTVKTDKIHENYLEHIKSRDWEGLNRELERLKNDGNTKTNILSDDQQTTETQEDEGDIENVDKTTEIKQVEEREESTKEIEKETEEKSVKEIQEEREEFIEEKFAEETEETKEKSTEKTKEYREEKTLEEKTEKKSIKELEEPQDDGEVIEKYQEKITLKDLEIKQIKKSLEENEIKIKELEKENSDLGESILNTTRKLNTSEGEVKTLKEVIKLKDKQLLDSKNRYELMRDQNRNLTTALKISKDKFTDVNETLFKTNEENRRLRIIQDKYNSIKDEYIELKQFKIDQDIILDSVKTKYEMKLQEYKNMVKVSEESFKELQESFNEFYEGSNTNQNTKHVVDIITPTVYLKIIDEPRYLKSFIRYLRRY